MTHEESEIAKNLNIIAGRQLASNQVSLTLMAIINAMVDDSKTAVLDKVIAELERYYNDMTKTIPKSGEEEMKKALLSGIEDTLNVLKGVRSNF